MASLEFEYALLNGGTAAAIAGIDEAGRGAIAGPVVAAAVIFPVSIAGLEKQLDGVNDSKQLSANLRRELDQVVRATATAFGVGVSTAAFVDSHGVVAATKAAMLEAVTLLEPGPDYLLIDGRIRLSRSTLPQQSIIRGDSRSLSIAAASILAKVARDKLMIELDALFPGYGFARHKGYGTRAHLHALSTLGPSPEHRLSFAPLKAKLL